MRNLYLVIIALGIGVATFGCSSSGRRKFRSGTYVGTFSNSTSGAGAISLTLAAGGQVTGSEINTTNNTTSTLSGTVTSAGLATITDGTGSYLGHLILTTSTVTDVPSTLDGTLTSTTSAATSTITTTSTLFGSVGSYAGSFSGPYTASNSTSGTLALVIGPNGAATLLIDNTTSSTTTTATGAITSAGDLSVAGNGQTISGTLTLSGNSLNGILTTSTGQTITASPGLTIP